MPENKMSEKSDKSASVMLLVVSIIWGTTYPLTRYVVGHFAPTVVLAIRFTLASSVLFLVYGKRLKTQDKSIFKYGILMGILLFVGYILQTVGAMYTESSKQAFLTGIYVVLVPFLAAFYKKKMFSLKELVSGFLCFVGLYILSNSGIGSGLNRGDILSLISTLFFAWGVVIAADYNKIYDSMMLTAIQLATVAFLALVGSIFFGEVPKAGPVQYAVLMYLTFMATLITLPLQNYCQKHVTASAAAVILGTETFFGGLFGIILLSEPFSARFIVGGSVCFIAIILSSLPDRSKKESHETNYMVK